MHICTEYWVCWNADQHGPDLGYHLCVGPGGGSPDGLLFPLLLSTRRDLVVQNKCMLYFLPNTSLHDIAVDGLASCRKFM